MGLSKRWTAGLHLNAAQYATLIAQAHADAPAETCGIIGGIMAGRGGQAQSVIPLPNVARVPTVRYTIDSRAFPAAYRQIEAAGGELIAIYHSHPQGDPIPSVTDLAEATWPEAAYVIVGLRDPASPQVAAWQIRDRAAAPIVIHMREIDQLPASAR